MPPKAFLGEDPELANEYYVAEKLGRFAWELDDMPNLEFLRWTRYFTVKEQSAELANRAAAARAGR